MQWNISNHKDRKESHKRQLSEVIKDDLKVCVNRIDERIKQHRMEVASDVKHAMRECYKEMNVEAGIVASAAPSAGPVPAGPKYRPMAIEPVQPVVQWELVHSKTKPGQQYWFNPYTGESRELRTISSCRSDVQSNGH